MTITPPSPEVLRTLLRYEPDTGLMFWLPRPETMFPGTGNGGSKGEAARFNGQFAGRRALTAFDTHGYHSGNVLGVHCLAHRVAFALQTGRWPDGHIDHINRVRVDNRWVNLRVVSNEINCRNRRRNKNNRSGRVGVCWHKANGNWTAHIGSGPTREFLGSFASFERACDARENAEAALGYINDGQLAA